MKISVALILKRKAVWGLALATITLSIFLALYLSEKSDEKKDSLPDSYKKTERLLNEDYNSSQDSSKLESLINALTLSDEETSSRPAGVSEEQWRVAVFFHRQKLRDQNGFINFYGRVIDQHGNPVVGADIFGYSDYYVVSLAEQRASGGGKRERKYIEAKSDMDGLFVVDGYEATNLNFTEVKKSGYHSIEKLPTGLIFGNGFSKRYESDPSSPVIFPMWEKGNTEPLIKAKWRKSVIPDGTTYTLDIESGRVVNNGNLRIKILANYDSIPDTNKYSWTLEISSPGGAVIESNDAFLYKAPKSNYEESLVWKVQEGKEWSRDLKRSLYVRLKSGAYAGVTIDTKVYHTNSARIVVNSLINPSGSPNLEYDPSKELKGQK